MFESVMQVAGGITLSRPFPRIGPIDVALRQARTCFGQLAGALGVSIADALRANGAITAAETGAEVTTDAEGGKRPFAASTYD